MNLPKPFHLLASRDTVVRYAAALALASTTAVAQAVPAVSLISPPSIGGVDGSRFIVGYRFQVNTDVSVSALGAYDYGMDGIQGGASVGLWTLDGNLLAQATVPGTTDDTTLEGYFRYVDIESISLSAGMQYVLGSYSTDPRGFFNANYGGVQLSTDPAISLLQNRDLPLGQGPYELTFPSREPMNVHLGSFGPNMLIDRVSADVPEPGTLASLALGLGAIGLARRRRPLD